MPRTKVKNGLFRKQKRRADGTFYESPTWWVRFQVAGRDVTRSTRETDRRRALVAARAIRAELEAAAPRGSGAGPGLTLDDLARWDQASRARKGVSRGQAEGVRYAWDRLLERLGSIDPRRLDYGQIVAYVDARLAEVRGQTVRKEAQALRRGLDEARRRGHLVPRIESWPEIPSSPPKAEQAGKLHDAVVLRRWLAELEHPTDPASLARHSPHAWLQAALILRTGLRIEEARRLTVDWLEVEDGQPYIRIPEPDAKTRRERVIALTPEGARLLLLAADLVDRQPGVPLVPGDYRRAWDSARRRIGYRPRITPRDLRHCYATFASHGGDVVSVQAALGHTDLRTTSRYVHGTDLRTVTASRAVAELLDGRDPKAGTPTISSAGTPAEDPDGCIVCGSRGGPIRTDDRLLPKQAWRTILELAATPEGSAALLDALECAGLLEADRDPMPGPLARVG